MNVQVSIFPLHRTNTKYDASINSCSYVDVDPNVDANNDTDPCIDDGFNDIKVSLNKTQNFIREKYFIQPLTQTRLNCYDASRRVHLI